MPNYVMNAVKLRGEPEKVQEVLELFRDNSGNIGIMDFNRVLPMPESLQIEEGSDTERGLEAYRRFEESGVQNEKAYLHEHPEVTARQWELGKQASRNIELYGSATWYDWCCFHWNTKWNAVSAFHSLEEGDECLRFETAWSAPTPVMEKLAEMFPDVEFEHSWADEDLGENCGARVYTNGSLLEEIYPEGNRDSMEFAAALWDLDLKELGYLPTRDGTGYVYVEAYEYELMEIFGKPALYTPGRFPFLDAPEGLYMYDFREGKEGLPLASVEKNVTVDHGGSILLQESLDLGKEGYILLGDLNYPEIVGEEEITIGAFLDGNYDHSYFEEQKGPVMT